MEPNSFTPPNILKMDKLNKWDGVSADCLAPLGSLQEDSFLELASIASNRPLPIEVPLEEPVNISHKVSVKGVVVPGSTEDVLAQGFGMLKMAGERIENAQQFYSWFSKVEEKMATMEAESYVEHLEALKNHREYCQHITEDVDKALAFLDKLEKEYVFVSTKTNALHEACEHLLADQTALMNNAESIRDNLDYFSELSRMQNKLTSPSLQVTGESFQAMLTRIDECIEFMQAHPMYQESSSYKEKYKASLLTALGMIKSYVIKSLESTTQAIQNRKTATTVVSGTDDAFTLYYGKFRTNAPRIKELMEQIEQRVEKDDRYQHLLSDIHHCYFNQREALLGPSVTSAMTELVNLNKQDHCALVRSGCSFMVHVCEDEYQLYGHFFSAQSPKLHEMLLRLCGNLYDLLRPLIIHIYHLETLAELCTILKTEMIDDHVQNNPQQLQAFHSVSLQMLEDVQERLVYRANIYIRDDIIGYKPSPGDLAYPEKLQMMEEIAQSLKQPKQSLDGSFMEIKLDEPDSGDGKLASVSGDGRVQVKKLSSEKFQTSPADMHGMWYPTVRRVLVCLSKLYRCVDKSIFQGLSQEALEACVQSLVTACNGIKDGVGKRKSTKQTSENKVVDAQLFLIKHLLILREQIAPFHAEFAIKETQLDFSRTKDAAFKFVWEPRSLANILKVNASNPLLQFMYEGTPEVKEFYIDSKKDVDRQLKLVCEEFIQYQTDLFCGVLSEFLDKASKFVNMSKEDGKGGASLRQQAFATPEILHDLVGQVYRDLKLRVKKSASSMALYLANKETENILFKPVKLNVQHVFQQLHITLIENYTEEDQAIVAAPSSDQVGLVNLVILSNHLAKPTFDRSLSDCMLEICLVITPCTASVFSMTAISLDRYWSIMHPLKYDYKVTKERVIILAVLIWLVAIFLGFAPFLGWGIQLKEFLEIGQTCSFLLIMQPSYVIFTCFGIFVPQLVLITYIYVAIFKVSRKHHRKISAAKLGVINPCFNTSQSVERSSLDAVQALPRSRSCPDFPLTGREERAASLFPESTRTVRFSVAGESSNDSRSPAARKLSMPAGVTGSNHRRAADRELANGPKLSLVSAETLPVVNRRRGDVLTRAASLRRCVSYSSGVSLSTFATQMRRVFPKHSSTVNIKALRTVTLVIGCFFIMWTPFLIVSCVQLICGASCHLHDHVGTYLLLLGVTNSAINPLVYTYTNRELKKRLCLVCGRKRRRVDINKPVSNCSASSTGNNNNNLSVPRTNQRNGVRGGSTPRLQSISRFISSPSSDLSSQAARFTFSESQIWWKNASLPEERTRPT